MVAQHPPAFCTKHGLFLATQMVLDQGSTASILWSETSCPACGASSEILPGFYQVLKDRLDVLIDSSITADALRALQDIALRLQRNEITTAQAVDEAVRISPKLRNIFRGLKQETVAAVAAAIIAAVTAIYIAKTSNATSVIINNYGSSTVTAPGPAVGTKLALPDIGPIPVRRPALKNQLSSSSSIPKK
ncbi:MAG: hypothetical protein ACJ8EW_02705 [Rhizobium sp.]|uniref:hypothetical protein n=1 Tax=Rhizobium sp. TaxID=391 RepID=UPI00389A0450